MDKQQYKAAICSVELVVNKTPYEVFDRIADLAKWWPEDTDSKDLGPGVSFGLSLGEGHYSKNRVTDFDRGRRFAWITTSALRKADGFDWTGTKMIFELTSEDGKTRVKYTYDGVVPEPETDRLIQICDITIKDLLRNYIVYGKTKQDFTVTVTFDRPMSAIFKALTHDVVKWWGGRDLTGSTAGLHDEFIIHHPGAHYSRQKIVELVPDERLVWLVTGSELGWLERNKQEWTGTKMIFELTGEPGKTQLRFTHVGLTPGKECYDTCSRNGWDIVIRDYLYRYIIEGKLYF